MSRVQRPWSEIMLGVFEEHQGGWCTWRDTGESGREGLYSSAKGGDPGPGESGGPLQNLGEVGRALPPERGGSLGVGSGPRITG